MDPSYFTPEWLSPSLFPELLPGQVHLWRFSLEQPSNLLPSLSALLSELEQAQARRFAFERHRNRYLISHAFLHSILSGYLKLLPQAIRFNIGPHGKPTLAQDLSPDLKFNLAHSNELAILGIRLRSEIGVDIEFHRVGVDYMKLAAQFFSSRENAALKSLPNSQREAGFFNAWTRKEAYLKSLGDGLSRPLDSFSVTLAPGDPPRLLDIDQETNKAERLQVFSFTPEIAYTAAVVTKSPVNEISFWHAGKELIYNS